MSNYYELDSHTAIDYVNSKLDFFDSDAQYECHEIGDGNLNLVFRIKDKNSHKSIVVKQALPYVRAAGEDWPLDINRGEIETKILKIEYDLTNGLVPKVYAFDKEMYCMIMEDLSDYIIMRYGLLDVIQYPKFADQITDFLVKTLLLTSDVVMEHQMKKERVKQFINPELCEITEDLVYEEPFYIGARNNIEEELKIFHAEFIDQDLLLKKEVAKLKFDFMNNAQALLHGDLHTGSIFVNQENTKVIDPEFAFYGPMAYDIGALIANLIMNYISTNALEIEQELKQTHMKYLRQTIVDVIDLFKAKALAMWDDVVKDKMAKVTGFKEWYINDVLINTAGVTGCEMIRRTVGFAHVKDLDGIEGLDRRIIAKKINLKIGKRLIMNREKISFGDAYLDVIDDIFKEHKND